MNIKKIVPKSLKTILFFVLRALLNGHILYYIFWLIQMAIDLYLMIPDYDPLYYLPSSPSPNESFPVVVIITLLLIALMIFCCFRMKKIYNTVWCVINLCMGFALVHFLIVTFVISLFPMFIVAVYLEPRSYF